MTITLEPAMLNAIVGDGEGLLARHDGRLFAVLACLGAMHEELAGHWYVEAVFGDCALTAGQAFPSLDAFRACVGDAPA